MGGLRLAAKTPDRTLGVGFRAATLVFVSKDILR
jgi:hypothetical protein